MESHTNQFIQQFLLINNNKPTSLRDIVQNPSLPGRFPASMHLFPPRFLFVQVNTRDRPPSGGVTFWFFHWSSITGKIYCPHSPPLTTSTVCSLLLVPLTLNYDTPCFCFKKHYTTSWVGETIDRSISTVAWQPYHDPPPPLSLYHKIIYYFRSTAWAELKWEHSPRRLFVQYVSRFHPHFCSFK